MNTYEIITNRITETLEAGTVPWVKPWKGGVEGMPRNFVSTKEYRGINVFLLSATAMAKGFSSPFWVSYKQAASLGGTVRKGEKSFCPVVFYSKLLFDAKDGDRHVNDDGKVESFVLRYTPVFNVEQCEGLKVPDISGAPKFEHEIIAAAQAIVDGMPNRPTIHNDRESGRAYYRIATDTVTVPYLAQFPKAEEYYSTLFHELGHSTGAKHRIDRDFGQRFGDHTYSKEELVAEFTASYLCGIAGIESRTLENSSAYIASWLNVLKDRKNLKWIAGACAQAQKAADYIRGKTADAVFAPKIAA